MASILVVEDEWAIAEWLHTLLLDQGHTVTVVRNGMQALEYLAKQRPDLILTDFVMPVLDGAGLLRALADEPAFADIPVVLMSSLQETSIREQCSGYRAFLRKPCREADLLKILDGVLGPKAG